MNPDTKYTGYDCPARDESGDLPVEYMAAVMLGYAPDCDNLEIGQQREYNFERETLPTWNWGMNNYRLRRPAPEPVYANWTADDVPAGCWLAYGNLKPPHWLVVAVLEDGVRGIAGFCQQARSFSELRVLNYFYSTDRKTWLPCRKEVKS